MCESIAGHNSEETVSWGVLQYTNLFNQCLSERNKAHTVTATLKMITTSCSFGCCNKGNAACDKVNIKNHSAEKTQIFPWHLLIKRSRCNDQSTCTLQVAEFDP